MVSSEKIVTREFLVLNGIIFLVFCNVAVFFQFQHYLQHELHLPPDSLGILIGLFAFTALIVRPVISPFLHSDNARKWIGLSAGGVILSLLLYYPSRTFWPLAFVRILHGGLYVVLATAAMTKMMDFIPPSKSGQAFGLITVITLLPYAVMPPLLEPLIRTFGGFVPVLFMTAFLMVLVFPLTMMIKIRADGPGRINRQKIRPLDLMENLKDKQIVSLLVISLFVYTAFAPVFFFLKEYALKIGLKNPGWFFSLSTFTEIAVRLFGGPLLDKGNKTRTLIYFLSGLTGAYLLLALRPGPFWFYILGLGFGICWGVIMPLLNSLIFDRSEPRFRAVNTNLAMVMFQGGFFLGPLLGGWVLTDWDYPTLFYVCGGMVFISFLMTPFLKKPTKAI